ncbi:quinone-dependent dihydroorotate dehydrogenase, partial [Leptospira sp. 201903071]|nr:quinone-dependent dihydroorotate dehydrogenase [Leptospira ainazelensis]
MISSSLRHGVYKAFLKPLFLSLDPETAHEFAKTLLGASRKIPGFLS